MIGHRFDHQPDTRCEDEHEHDCKQEPARDTQVRTSLRNAAKDERFYGGVDEKAGTETRNLIAVPLLLRGDAIGVLEAVNSKQGPFTPDDVEIASALAALAAVAIDNASMYARLADAVVTARLSYRL